MQMTDYRLQGLRPTTVFVKYDARNIEGKRAIEPHFQLEILVGHRLAFFTGFLYRRDLTAICRLHVTRDAIVLACGNKPTKSYRHEDKSYV